ncbi:MAG: DegQ family serine endoprotease [Rhodobacter sp.]|nr:DegQ family serine endoprotease [Rhodobacter sp.]MCA3512859.1 DegQ family serine endoprotease [Rhodobacter sp.]MCA3520829.1 DegQ family serine endoprotease [Rhodobacter sp.]MCA3522515.1 DegQ family serine endoprotease [Rhodobacter sp.]MCA3527071.1 DegQ family serine endoprotease [Rhodobacter sp.]
MQSNALSIARPNAAQRFAAAAVLGLALAVTPAIEAAALGAPDTFADLATQISPSVVNITTSSVVSASIEDGPMVPPGSPFEEFFRDFQNRNGQGDNAQPRRSEALGSGFVISEDGYIVTNNHVIEGADEIKIEFYSGETLDAKLVGTDPKTDIALLKVESDEPLPFVQFGDSDLMRVGDWVMAMGNPLGQGFSVSAGIVSARNRALSGSYDDFIQTDAAINRGNSGGPLFNMDGEVIGVNTAILSPNGGSIGIGFSMASNVVSKVTDQLREFGETRRGWLGVRIQDVTPDVAEAMGLADARGALVTDVPEGPAREAGMQAGDVITKFDGVEVADTRELVRKVADTEVGKATEVIVLRDGKTETLTITLGRREEAEAEAMPAAAAPPAEPQVQDLLGLTVATLTPEAAESMGLPSGSEGLVVMAVDAASEAYAKGLREGDLITEAGQRKVETTGDLENRITEAREAGRKSLLLLVRRDGDPRFVALSVEK